MKNLLLCLICIAFLLGFQTASAQNLSVKGTVRDSIGNTLPGVSVQVKAGNNHGITTNVNGEYTLNNISPSDTLVFSYVGYNNERIAVKNRSVIDVKLRQNNGQLAEVVVVGYGTQKRAEVTGAISTVTAKELEQAPVVDVTNALAGRVPGLIAMQQSGEPGFSSTSLNIRGFGAPLVIVDGVESSITNLNPNEIESISFLKDASAAVYGARAGNGVILVTSKRGSIGKPTIQLTSTYSLQTVTEFPKPLNAGQYATLIDEAETNSGTPATGLKFTPQQVQDYVNGAPGYQSTNWYTTTMNTYSPLLQENLAVSGGSEAIKYYTFFGYTGQTGMYKSGDNTYNKYNLRTNVDGKISNDLTVSMDISATEGILHSPTRPQANLWQDFYSLEPTYPATLPDPTKIAYGGYIESTIATTTRALGGYNDQDISQVSASLSAKYLVPGVKGLYLKELVNYLQNSTEGKEWIKAYTMYTYDPTSGAYTPWQPAPVTSLTETYDKAVTITNQLSLNYDRTFQSGHRISALALMEVSNYSENYFSAARSGYITTAIDQLFAGGQDGQSANGTASETGRISYVGRLDYSYKDKYLLESTMRYDGSPNFPADKRWGFFPSVSAGWRINEESFFKNSISWVDNLKLRASVSTTGFDGIGAYQYLTGYQFANAFIANNTIRQGLISTGLANPDITWEQMTTYNVGLDFSVNHGIIYGTLDGFFRNRNHILASPVLTLPNTFGATLPLENIDSQNARGFEITVGHKDKIGDFSYDVSGNFAFTRAKWVHYAEPDYTDPDDIRIHQVSGRWTDVVWGYVANGLFTSEQEIKNYPLDQDGQKNATIQPGDIKYVDQNHDGVLDWRDEQPIGLGNQPEITFGFNLNASYKRFSLSALIQGAAKNDVLLDFGVQNFSNQPNVVYDDRWTTQNDNANAIIPRQYMGGKVNNTYVSTYWLKNASYGRLKTLNIGYDFTYPAIRRLGISGLRLYFAGTNLFTVSGLLKYHIDPEAPSGIMTGNYYPQQKVYSLGLNASF